MGLFYSNLTVFRPVRTALRAELRRLKREAYLSPTIRRHTVVFDKAMEEQDGKVIERLGKAVTKALSCSALAAVLHDDDVLYLWLFDNGRVRDRYDSCPSYFDPHAIETAPPAGGNAKTLCEAFGRPRRADRVEALLRANLLWRAGGSGGRASAAGRRPGRCSRIRRNGGRTMRWTHLLLGYLCRRLWLGRFWKVAVGRRSRLALWRRFASQACKRYDCLE